jgi:hypothetical protein
MGADRLPVPRDAGALPEPWRWLAEGVVRFSAGQAAEAGQRPPPAELFAESMIEPLRRQRLLALLPQLLPAALLPRDWKAQVRKERLAISARQLRLERRARQLAELAERHGGIRLLFIKGLPLSAHHYAAGYQRSTGDVDVVVEAEALPALVKAVDAEGWGSIYAVPSKDWREERAEGAKHLEDRAAPGDPACIVEIHTGRYVTFAGWDWSEVWKSDETFLLPWPEMGRTAFRMRPELEFLLAPLHALSDGFPFPFQALSDAGHLARHADRPRLLEAARATRTRGLAAVQARLWGSLAREAEWTEWAAAAWGQAGHTERRLGRYYARYFWRSLPGQPQPPRFALDFAQALAAGLFVPVRVAERVLGTSRDEPGFQRRRLGHLLRRWGKFLGAGGRGR